MIQLRKPQEGAKLSLQTEVQKDFIAEEEKRAAMDGALTFKWYALERDGSDRTLPKAVHFAWEEMLDEEEKPVDAYYFLLISEDSAMTAPAVFMTKDREYDVYNLKVGTKYWFCVQKEGKRSAVSFFETLNELPRCLKIDGISNVRDMGGYAVDGGKLRQGLIYRGGEFELHMHLTPDGAEELCKLGIRTDLDMRGEAIGKVDYSTVELLGIKRAFIPYVPYTDVFEKKNKASTKKFYKVFANPKNYPIYYHCWGGADRTGTSAFILGAFFGMSYEDLIYEYEFTSLSIWGTRSRNYPKFAEFVDLSMALEGETLHDKAATYLKEYAGLTDKQLNTIYNVMVERSTQESEG